MTSYKLKRKVFTKYDDTDALKQMKDSDILAEQKKKQNKARAAGDITGKAIGGALLGGTLAGVAGAAKGAISAGAGNRQAGALSGLKGGGASGAVLGALAGSLMAAHKINKKSRENAAYNDRLKYAQRQAARRERKDWKNNMTNREGYTY